MDSDQTCQKQELNGQDEAASTVAHLHQQKEKLLKQHEILSIKNNLMLTEAYKQNAMQKVNHEELLSQQNVFAKKMSDIKQKNHQLSDCQTKTTKAFNRATTFMILQLEKVTDENKQALVEESNRNEELKMINEKLFTQLDKLTAENAQLALECSRSNAQLLAENELLLHQSDQLANRISHANEQLETKEEEISAQLDELATRIAAVEKDLIELDLQRSKYTHLILQNNQSRKRRAHVLSDNTHDNSCDGMAEYTKCCVCLEPYEVESTSNEKRLPIKSATCTHTLCEECVDNCFASLLSNGKSNVRYVPCPQCRTKRAFDVQNKVVDSFLREYIMSRCNTAFKGRAKSNDKVETVLEESEEDMMCTGSSSDSMIPSIVSSPRNRENAVATVDIHCFKLMFEGAVAKHKSNTMDILSRSVGKGEGSIPFDVIEKARDEAFEMMQHANTFIFVHGGVPYNEQDIAEALSEAENDALQMCKQQKDAFLSLYRKASSVAMHRMTDNGCCVYDVEE